VPFTARMHVEVGDFIHRGTPLTEGSIQPKHLLQVRDTLSVETYLLAEVQKVYRSQGLKSATSTLKSWCVKCFVSPRHGCWRYRSLTWYAHGYR
jgi:hypothetical protein